MSTKQMSSSRWRHHVVLVVAPVLSHTMPFFGLATRLTSRGVKVTMLAFAFQVEQIWNDAAYRKVAPGLRALQADGDGFDLVPVAGTPSMGTLEERIASMQASAEANLIAAFATSLAPVMSSPAATTTSDVPTPCCIISDMLVGWTQDLARKFGIPRYILHIQSAANFSLMLHAVTLVAEGRLPLNDSNQNDLIEFPGMKLHPSELPTDLHGDELCSFSYDLYMRMSHRAAEAPIVLVNTFREFEEHVFVALDHLYSRASTFGQQVPRVIPVGPLFSPPAPESTLMDAGEESLFQWLDTKPPRSVLYIAFGTHRKFGWEEMKEFALGLQASEQYFLFAARLGKIHPDINTTTSPDTLTNCLPPGFEERTKERGKIVTWWVPQTRILNHPACGAFFSQGGWVSILETISAGVPMLTLPHRAEQKMNSRFLVDIAMVAVEVNRDLNTGFVMKEEVERVARLVLQDKKMSDSLRSRVVELKQKVAPHITSCASLDPFLVELAKIDGPRGDHSLLYFAYTCIRDLFIGGVNYLAKKIIR